VAEWFIAFDLKSELFFTTQVRIMSPMSLPLLNSAKKIKNKFTTISGVGLEPTNLFIKMADFLHTTFFKAVRWTISLSHHNKVIFSV